MKTVLNKFIVVLTLVFTLLIICVNSKVFAANLNVNVNFDGKKIEMTSETPDMTWYINNLLPGEEDSTILTISNIGKRNVSVDFTATIEEGKQLADILDIKIIKLANDSQKADEEVFNGKYSNLQELSVNLDVDKLQKFKIITAMPIEAGNEYQNKECKVKLGFIAKGEEDAEPKPEPPKEIITDVIKPVQTGETYTIYIVLAVLTFTVAILIVSFCIGKSKKKKDK